MTIRSVVIADCQTLHTYVFRPTTSNHNVCIYCCIIEFEWKYVNVMHETSFTSMLAPVPVV